MNTEDFAPENEWADYDQRIFNVHPRLPPQTPWTGEELCKHFCTLKTKFALVDECFCRSGIFRKSYLSSLQGSLKGDTL
jgi:hypothetical protein